MTATATSSFMTKIFPWHLFGSHWHFWKSLDVFFHELVATPRLNNSSFFPGPPSQHLFFFHLFLSLSFGSSFLGKAGKFLVNPSTCLEQGECKPLSSDIFQGLWDTKHHQAPGTFVKQFNEETRNTCSMAFASRKFEFFHLKNTEGLGIQPHH